MPDKARKACSPMICQSWQSNLCKWHANMQTVDYTMEMSMSARFYFEHERVPFVGTSQSKAIVRRIFCRFGSFSAKMRIKSGGGNR